MITRKRIEQIVEFSMYELECEEDYFFRITYQLKKRNKALLISCWNRNNMLAANSLSKVPLKDLTEVMVYKMVEEAYQYIYNNQPSNQISQSL